MNSRAVNDAGQAIYTENGVTTFKSLPNFFIRITLELTNKTHVVQRVYRTFMAQLGLLGGNF